MGKWFVNEYDDFPPDYLGWLLKKKGPFDTKEEAEEYKKTYFDNAENVRVEEEEK